jgi:cytochrome d ubiquinol oxidase subunit II
LIFRGVSFEFRGKAESSRWRSFWDWSIFLGSLIPALLWGVAFANFVRGVPIDANMNYVGGFWNLLNVYALLGGLTAISGFMLHGAVFISLKTSGNLMEDARKSAMRLWLPTLIILMAFTVATYFSTDILSKLGVNPGPIPIGAILALLVTGWFIREQRVGWAFLLTSLTIILVMTTLFMVLYPRVLVSSINPDWSLTITNSSSSPYTLQVMSIVALIFVPIVLVYQAWSYWLFRKRLTEKVEGLEY